MAITFTQFDVSPEVREGQAGLLTIRSGQLLIQGTSSSKVDLGSTNWNSDTAAQASLKDTTGGSWTKTGSQAIDGISYDIYHHSSAGASLQQDVYIQQGLTII